MATTTTINVLGETPRERWINVVKIHKMCVLSNLDVAYDKAVDRQEIECIDKAYNATERFADDMCGFIEQVFDILEEDDD